MGRIAWVRRSGKWSLVKSLICRGFTDFFNRAMAMSGVKAAEEALRVFEQRQKENLF